MELVTYKKFICLPSNKVVEKSIEEDIDDVVVDNINFTLCYSLFYAKMSQSFLAYRKQLFDLKQIRFTIQ